MGFSILTPSTTLVVPTSEVRDHVRGSTADNTWLTGASLAAQRWCENYTARSLFNQTFRETYTSFPKSGRFTLARQPGVSSTLLAISYLKAGGSTWTAYGSSNWRLHMDEPSAVVLKYNKSWPSATYETGEAIRLQFVAGYGSSTGGAVIPPEFKHAIKLLTGHWYENREAVVVGTVQTKVKQTVDSLLWMYKWR